MTKNYSNRELNKRSRIHNKTNLSFSLIVGNQKICVEFAQSGDDNPNTIKTAIGSIKNREFLPDPYKLELVSKFILSQGSTQPTDDQVLAEISRLIRSASILASKQIDVKSLTQKEKYQAKTNNRVLSNPKKKLIKAVKYC